MFEFLEHRNAPCSIITQTFSGFSPIDEGSPAINVTEEISENLESVELLLLDSYQGPMFSIENGAATFTPPPLDLEYGGWTTFFSFHAFATEQQQPECIHQLRFDVIVNWVDPKNPLDVNNDNTISIDDIDQIFQMAAEGVVEDYNNNGRHDLADAYYALELAGGGNSCDLTLDGVFDSKDFVQALSAGKYHSNENATFSEGDMQADGYFTSADLVFALRNCIYNG